jgi:propionyl-CoA carboxylase alpha chain
VAVPVDGRVTELAVTEGHQVEQGSVLAVVTPEDEDRGASDTVETAKETP